MIKLFKPYVPEEAKNLVDEVLSSSQLAQGSKVEQFEKEFSRLFNVPYVVSVNSGSSALETAFDLLELKAGDEVISTPFTCSATNIPLIRRGCKIIWADVLEDSLCIDPRDVWAKCTPDTKAIIQVHLGGVKAAVQDYLDAQFSCQDGDTCLCDFDIFSIPIVSDACQALGIFASDFNCFSFQAIKHITTGDGGMLVLGKPNEIPEYWDAKRYRKAKLLRWFGIDRERPVAQGWQSYRERMMSFDIEVPGYKRHMNDISAALGLAGLRQYGQVMVHRKNIFEIYKSRLKNIDGIKLIDGEENVYWLCTVLVERRDDFARVLYEAGIETNLVQVRNDTYKIFGGKRADLPVLNKIESKYLSLPLGMHVSEENVNYICDIIKKGW